MSKINNESEFINEAKKVHQVVATLTRLPDDLAADKLNAVISTVENATLTIKKIKDDLAKAVDAKDVAISDLKELIKRVRSATKGIYGDDSLEYEQVGGKRSSEIKRAHKNPS